MPPDLASLRAEVRFAVEAVRRLPWPVAWFTLRARRAARRDGDLFSLQSALRPAKLGALLEVAAGRRHVAELGTGTAWTTIALAIADEERRIVSYDPVLREQRERYLAIAGPRVARRITFLTAPGEDGPGEASGIDLLFIDSSHEREPTAREFRAWRPALAPAALVVFDDFGHPGYPGVAQAVDDLGLRAQGEERESVFLWRAPA